MQHKLLSPGFIISIVFCLIPTITNCRRAKKRKKPDIVVEQVVPVSEIQPEPIIEAVPLENVVEAHTYHVHVLLAESVGSNMPWVICAEKGVEFTDSLLDDGKKLSSPETTYEIHFHDGFFYVNKKRLRSFPFVIKPQEGYLVFQGKPYHGYLMLQIEDGRGMLINHVDLEDYVCAVLKTEGWPGWPLEMYKVLAITCRTYVMAMIKEAKAKERAYHVRNTNKHQTYEGAHQSPVLRRAVDETKGIFLTHNNQPILAMFDICCGGVIPAGISGFNFERAPYLAREYACTHCKKCKSYSWNVSMDKDELITYLQKEYPQLTAVRDVKITEKDTAGLVKEALIKGARAVCTLTGRKLYSCIKGIRSYCFDVTKKGSTVTFKGRGFGHHIGLCQWGARAMVDDGWCHTSILSFYYPETKLMRLT